MPRLTLPHFDESGGDLFSGLNDGLLTRAEALAAVDIGKHQASSPPVLPQLKHDMMYHHGMGAPHPGAPNTRPHQLTGVFLTDGDAVVLKPLTHLVIVLTANVRCPFNQRSILTAKVTQYERTAML
uniref:Uncharacterized protein n=1 Tax=Timema genevievae TaxID=629358 RepID=A0A7R9JPP5_TIMGE|nr:unnamed protein product [Timema genevievae]